MERLCVRFYKFLVTLISSDHGDGDEIYIQSYKQEMHSIPNNMSPISFHVSLQLILYVNTFIK